MKHRPQPKPLKKKDPYAGTKVAAAVTGGLIVHHYVTHENPGVLHRMANGITKGNYQSKDFHSKWGKPTIMKNVTQTAEHL